MSYVQNEIHKVSEILDVFCANKIGNNDSDLCLTQMQYVQHVCGSIAYKCPKCNNYIEIQVERGHRIWRLKDGSFSYVNPNSEI